MRVRGSDHGAHCVVSSSISVTDFAAFVLDEDHIEATWTQVGIDAPCRVTVTSDPLNFTGLGEADLNDADSVVSLSDAVTSDTDVFVALLVQDSCGQWAVIASFNFNTGD